MNASTSSRSGSLPVIGISIRFPLTWMYVVYSNQNCLGGDFNEHKQHAIINIRKKIILNYLKHNVCSYRIFSYGPKNGFQIAMVNEPSMFKPLKFYCIWGAPVAQWVKPWPTDLADPSLILTRGEIFSTVNGVPLHTAFHYHPNIVLIWLKYC